MSSHSMGIFGTIKALMKNIKTSIQNRQPLDPPRTFQGVYPTHDNMGSTRDDTGMGTRAEHVRGNTGQRGCARFRKCTGHKRVGSFSGAGA